MIYNYKKMPKSVKRSQVNISKEAQRKLNEMVVDNTYNAIRVIQTMVRTDKEKKQEKKEMYIEI